MSAASVSVQSPAVLALQQSPIPALRKLKIEETEQGIVITGALFVVLASLAADFLLAWLDPRIRG